MEALVTFQKSSNRLYTLGSSYRSVLYTLFLTVLLKLDQIQFLGGSICDKLYPAGKLDTSVTSEKPLLNAVKENINFI